jgi:hypothetical protein
VFGCAPFSKRMFKKEYVELKEKNMNSINGKFQF